MCDRQRFPIPYSEYEKPGQHHSHFVKPLARTPYFMEEENVDLFRGSQMQKQGGATITSYEIR